MFTHCITSKQTILFVSDVSYHPFKVKDANSFHTRFSSECREQVDIMKLRRNVVIVAEALARFIYNLTDKVRQTSESQ